MESLETKCGVFSWSFQQRACHAALFIITCWIHPSFVKPALVNDLDQSLSDERWVDYTLLQKTTPSVTQPPIDRQPWISRLPSKNPSCGSSALRSSLISRTSKSWIQCRSAFPLGFWRSIFPLQMDDAWIRFLRSTRNLWTETRTHRWQHVGHMEKSRLRSEEQNSRTDWCQRFPLSRSQSATDYDLEMTEKYGETFGIFDGTVPNLVTSDAELIRFVMIKGFDHFTNRRVRPNSFLIDLDTPSPKQKKRMIFLSISRLVWPIRSISAKCWPSPETRNGGTSAQPSLRLSPPEKSNE